MFKKLCAHGKLAFLGYQETLKENEYLMLYSCLFCHSTVSKKKIVKQLKIKEDKILNTNHII